MSWKALITVVVLTTPWTFVIAGTIYLLKKYNFIK